MLSGWNKLKGLQKSGLAFVALLLSALILVACGGGGSGSSSGSSSSSSDETTLLTAPSGSSNVTCAKNAQCIDQIFRTVSDMPNTLSLASTSWTDTSTAIVTISQIPFVEGSNSATYYDPQGSAFDMFVNPRAIVPGFEGNAQTGARIFIGNGLPSTKMGTFPVQSGTTAYNYYEPLPGGTNPAGTDTATGWTSYVNAAAIGISPYPLNAVLPLHPEITPAAVANPNPINALIVGITLTGAVWHVEKANGPTSGGSAAWYSPVNPLPMDACFGHPYNQQYHLHGYSWKCFPNQGTTGQSPIFGYALDGFPITGPRAPDGHEYTNSELDKCHGIAAPVTSPDGITYNYHYVLNREYPFSVGCFMGKVNYAQALGPVSDVLAPPGTTNPYGGSPTLYTNPYMKEGFFYPNVAYGR
jgi:hypothetical protein